MVVRLQPAASPMLSIRKPCGEGRLCLAQCSLSTETLSGSLEVTSMPGHT